MGEPIKNEGLDLAGLGKVAKAIPPAVYERSADALLITFEKLTAPITESTSGLGRYLRQKFDNLVEVEKAIATYTVEKAIFRAKERCGRARTDLRPPVLQTVPYRVAMASKHLRSTKNGQKTTSNFTPLSSG